MRDMLAEGEVRRRYGATEIIPHTTSISSFTILWVTDCLVSQMQGFFTGPWAISCLDGQRGQRTSRQSTLVALILELNRESLFLLIQSLHTLMC